MVRKFVFHCIVFKISLPNIMISEMIFIHQTIMSQDKRLNTCNCIIVTPTVNKTIIRDTETTTKT